MQRRAAPQDNPRRIYVPASDFSSRTLPNIGYVYLVPSLAWVALLSDEATRDSRHDGKMARPLSHTSAYVCSMVSTSAEEKATPRISSAVLRESWSDEGAVKPAVHPDDLIPHSTFAFEAH
ncbi:hypothetical protein EMPS_00172 [Entomortierella parvispora]|uniref:Uncharacterized protein n=1 Tax=Entomortierella parvispora TaxID=205924 RepID=A0A9P3LQV0_9FUNG|nr:hypothetical protein EMPS_00172 [Entomortierella parvispora]